MISTDRILVATGGERGASWAVVRIARHWLLVPGVVLSSHFYARFNALGGALGGFGRSLHLLRARAVAYGERPLRDFADAGVMGAWPALSYELPAIAQDVLGETFFAEAVLTVSLLALALAITAATAGGIAGRASAFVVVMATLFASTKLCGYSSAGLCGRRGAVRSLRAAANAGTCGAARRLVDDCVPLPPRLPRVLAAPVAILILSGTRGWREALDRLAVYAQPSPATRRSCLLDSSLRRPWFVSRNGSRTGGTGSQPHDVSVAAVCSRAGRPWRIPFGRGQRDCVSHDLSVAIPIVAVLR